MSVSKLAEKLNFNFMQVNGCRYFGPQRGHDSFNPPPGSEVFVGKLPPDYFEDEMYFLFRRVGEIFDMRLMVTFSGENRGYAYVRYYTAEDADRAIAALDGAQIRSNSSTRLYVAKSTDHRTLVIIGLPEGVTSLEVETVYSSKLPGEILSVEHVESRRPMFLIHFASHRAAAVTKRNHHTDSLPAHWGNNVFLMWQPNKEVEERLKARKERETMKNILLLSTFREISQGSANGQSGSASERASLMAAASASADYQARPLGPTAGIGLPVPCLSGNSNCRNIFGAQPLPTMNHPTINNGLPQYQALSTATGGVGLPLPTATGGVGLPLPTATGGVGLPLPTATGGVGLPLPTATGGVGLPLPASYLSENSNRRNMLEARPFNPAVNNGSSAEYQAVPSANTARVYASIPVSRRSENSNPRYIFEAQQFNPAMDIGPFGGEYRPMSPSPSAARSPTPPGFYHPIYISMLRAPKAPKAVFQPDEPSPVPQYGIGYPFLEPSSPTENSAHKDVLGACSNDKEMNVNEDKQAKENFADMSVKPESESASWWNPGYASSIKMEEETCENLNENPESENASWWNPGYASSIKMEEETCENLENINPARPVLGRHNMVKSQKHLRF